MIAYRRAELLLRERMEYDDGTFVEMVIWKLPMPVRGSGHDYLAGRSCTHSRTWSRWFGISWAMSKG
ncbi:MAG: hypothetical protein U1F31_13945 [Steroidobacteraceae bacterium]|nr:hypothetical protein [Bryobacterales bacterium]